MPAIADQVTNLEHDHIAALAQIDALTASLAAVTSANSSLTAENTALNKYADEIKAMVESVATGALHMLQAARAPIVAAVEKEVAKVVAEVKPLVLDVAGFLGADPINKPLTNVEAEQIANEEQDASNANAIASDSGDEQPTTLRVVDPPQAAINALQDSVSFLKGDISGSAQKAGIIKEAEAALAEPPASVAAEIVHAEPPASVAAEIVHAEPPASVAAEIVHADSGDAQPEPATVTPASPVVPPANIFETIKTEIAEIPDAVERMLHHSSASSAPPTTGIRRPVDLTMHVEHDPAGLPIFLRRGTAFEAMTRGIDA